MPDVPHRFTELMSLVASKLGDRPVTPELVDFLDREFPADGPVFLEIAALCEKGVEDGWLCTREAGGIKFSRPIKPSPVTNNFSVDVVEMTSLVGPHHAHPHGEIDMVMPLDDTAMFDGAAKGWKVYGPASSHSPTVTNGKALILYLLPQGAIEFTRG